MGLEIAAFLTQDGVVNGAIYALIAVGVVLVFNVSRVVFVSFGDLIAYSTLTLAEIEANEVPPMIWLVAGLACLAALLECADLLRRRRGGRIPRAIALYGAVPLLPVALAIWLSPLDLPMPLPAVLAVALVLPLGPLIYRIVFQPLEGASVLTMLMAAVAVHFVLAGLALLFFGAEGYRTEPYVSGSFNAAFVDVSWLSLVVLTSALLAVGLLVAFFARTILGKALRATAINGVGARVVGIRTGQAGAFSFLLATALAAISGVLIGPLITVYYDTGFLVGLKGFVGAVVGGLVSYPLAFTGAMLIGLIESFASFYSSAFKDVVVFTALIPIVIARFALTPGDRGEALEDEA